VEVVRKFRDFWLNHNVNSIPSALISKIGALNDSTLIRSNETELSKVYEVFTQFLITSQNVRGISPIFHPNYVPIIELLLSQGNTVELILTNAVLNKTMAATNQKQLFNYLKKGTLQVFLNDNLKFALTVTDKNFSLGLFAENGIYDDKIDLISLSPQAIKWGEELFLQTLKDSVKIDPDALRNNLA
jgi:predicted transcriptional regulator